MKDKLLGHLYKDGEIIIKQGTTGKCLYVIQEGKVEVINEHGDSEIKVAELGETEFFGEGVESESIERRKHPRFDVCGEVLLNRSSRGELLDLCQGGAKLKTLLRLFQDQIVDLDFSVQGIPIHARARVIHVTRGVIDERYTLGVCFEAIPTNQSELLSHHLETLSAEQGQPFYTA